MKTEYRIIKHYEPFFNHWAFTLQKKVNYWFFGKRFLWKYAAGNALTKSIPHDWDELNIIETITQEI